MRLLFSVGALGGLCTRELTLQLSEGASRCKCFWRRFRFGRRLGYKVPSLKGAQAAANQIGQTCSLARLHRVGIGLENDQYIQQPMNRRRISRLFCERYQNCAPVSETTGDSVAGQRCLE